MNVFRMCSEYDECAGSIKSQSHRIKNRTTRLAGWFFYGYIYSVRATLLISMSLCIIHVSCFGQDDDRKHGFWGRYNALDTSCRGYYVGLAKDDILAGTAWLYVQSRFSPITYSSQYTFEKRYHVRYDLSGCTLSDREECLTIYNKAVFHSLDSLYGGKWRRTVRTDVIGFHRRFLIFK